MDGSEALIVSRWFYLTAVMALFGSAVFPFYALEKAFSSRFVLLPRGANVAFALIVLIAAIGWLLEFALSIGGTQEFAETLKLILLKSSFGPVWLIRLSLALLLLVASFKTRPVLIALPALLLLTGEGWSGHAATWSLAGSLVQAIHVVCAGAWIGGLLSLSRLIAAARRDKSERLTAEAALWQFSRFGIFVVAVIALTGVVNTWQMLGGSFNFTRVYDRVLLLKIGLFALMVAIAASNRYRLLPHFWRAEPTPIFAKLSRNVALEQIIGVGVLLDVSVLGLLSPHLTAQ